MPTIIHSPFLSGGSARALSVLFGIYLTLAGRAQGSEVSTADYSIATWRVEDGLPQNSVNAIVQTRDGYIWVATYNGLARFDGVRFVTFGLKEDLGSSQVFRLMEDDKGDLWIGTLGGGLSRLRAGRLTTFTPQDGLSADLVFALAKDAAGAVWVGTSVGIFVWDGHRFQNVTPTNSTVPRGIWIVQSGRDEGIWALSSKTPDGDRELWRFRAGAWTRKPTEFKGSRTDFGNLFEDSAGNLWAGLETTRKW